MNDEGTEREKRMHRRTLFPGDTACGLRNVPYQEMAPDDVVPTCENCQTGRIESVREQ